MTDKGIEIIHLGVDAKAYVMENVEGIINFNRMWGQETIWPGIGCPVFVVVVERAGRREIIEKRTLHEAFHFIRNHRSKIVALEETNRDRVMEGLAPLSVEEFFSSLKEEDMNARMEDYLTAANQERRANGEPEYTMQEFIDSRRGPTIHNTTPTQPDSDTYGFGKALEAMNKGRRVARRGWNGKEMFVESVSGAEAKLTNGCTVALEAFFVLRSPNGRYNTWVPSVSDIMAHDWYELHDA